MLKAKAKRFFFGSFFRTAALSVILALLPAMIIMVSSEIGRFNDAIGASGERVKTLADTLAAQQALLAESSRIFLGNLCAMEAVRKQEITECLRIFDTLNNNLYAYQNIVLVDTTGKVLASALPFTDHYGLSRRYYELAERGRSFIAGDIHDDMLIFAAPVFSEQNKISAILILTVRLSYYNDRLEEMNVFSRTYQAQNGSAQGGSFSKGLSESLVLPEGSQVYLVDNNVNLAYTYSQQDGWRQITLPDSLGAVVRASGQGARDAILPDGSKVIAASAGMMTAENDLPYLHVLLTVPQVSAYADARVMLTIDVVLFGLAAAFSLFLTWLLCSWLFKRPAKSLLSHSLALKNGDLESRINLESMPGIFFDLAGKLNDIAKSLGKREHDLVQARSLAENAVNLKSEFLANMSHEIRTPMNAILGMTYLALKTEMQPNQFSYINKVQISGKALLRIINDILDFSKMEAGKLGMERVRFATRDLFSGLADRFQEQLEGKDVQLLIVVDHDVPFYLVGDPLRFEQAIGHLVEYSLQHTARGVVRVACALVGIVQNECSLRIVVADTGQGMHPDQLSVLCESLENNQQPPLSAYGQESMSGLGLLITQRLLMFMNGNLNISSEQGRGTVFTCTARFTYYATEQNLQIGALHGKRALIADGDEVVLPLLANLFSGFSMQATTKATATEAIAELLRADTAEEPYDFFLLDWRTAEIDGAEVLRQVKQRMQLKHNTPIIVMSSYGREDLRLMVEGAGANAFLHKPINGSVLLDTLMGLLSNENVLEETLQVEAGTAPTAVVTPRDLTGLRVLLVEDNQVNQELAKEIMEEVGVVVTVAANGSEALRCLGSSQLRPSYDIILMDLQMPVMDGYETTWRIRKDTHLEATHVPIIAMTAHSQSDEIEACRSAGMDDHVAKPIEVKLLFAALQRWAPLSWYEAGASGIILKNMLEKLISNRVQGIIYFDQNKRVLQQNIGEGRIIKLQRLLNKADMAEAMAFIRHLQAHGV